MPVGPKRDGYKFVGWVNDDGYLVNRSTKIDRDSTFTAYWLKEASDTVKIEFDTGTPEKINDIILEKGSTIVLPYPSIIKEGYTFDGWMYDNNRVSSNMIANKDMKFNAIWKNTYTCPEGCTPIGDGSSCNREITTNPVTTTVCPDGYSLLEGQCLDTSRQYFSELDSTGAGNWTCTNPNDGQYDEIEGLGAIKWCAPKADKVTTTSCPYGYTNDNGVCKITETVICSAN